jgi:hypothetical protein
VEELLPKNRRITIHEVSNVVGVPFGSVQRILKYKQPEKLEFGGLTNWNFRIGFSMQQCISFLCLVWT